MSEAQTPSPQPARPTPQQAGAAPPGLPPRVIVQLAPAPMRRLTQWIAWSGFILCGLALMQRSSALQDYYNTTEGVQEKFHSGDKQAADKIVILDISGVILEGDGFVKKQIDRVRQDERVRAVVVRVDSPGGTVTGSDYILHHLRRLREERQIPLVVSMGSLAASGGYYVAMAVGDQPKSIFAEPTTTTGSIGVMIPHYDVSALMERWNIKDDSIASHPRKFILSLTRPMPEDHRMILEKHVNEMFTRFKAVVHDGRPALRNAENRLEHAGTDLATGEVFTAQQALEYGLIDQVGFLEDAISRAAELAGVDSQKVRVVKYRRVTNVLESIVGESMLQRAGYPDQRSLLEGLVPRPYYLCTTVAPLVSSFPWRPPAVVLPESTSDR